MVMSTNIGAIEMLRSRQKLDKTSPYYQEAKKLAKELNLPKSHFWGHRYFPTICNCIICKSSVS